MTRFSISLQGGVEMVMHALEHAWGGEIFEASKPFLRKMELGFGVIRYFDAAEFDDFYTEKLKENPKLFIKELDAE